MIQLGNEVQDKVTGFKGFAVSRVEYLNGCIQYCVKPKAGNDGKMPEGEYIDNAQLEVVGIGIFSGIFIEVDSNGGPSSDTPPVRYSG